MAEISSSKLKPSFAYTVVYVRDVAYTVVYVRDVAKSVEFYSIRRLNQFHRHKWGKLESRETTIAFTPAHQHETVDITGVVKAPPAAKSETSPVQRAVENGAIPVSQPEDKKWGQRVGYVRDIDGLIVRMESYR